MGLAEALAIFGLPSNWSQISPTYVAALEDLPPDLLQSALIHVVKTYEYKFPKPATIRKVVVDEMARRSATVIRLEGILQNGRFAEPRRVPPTSEQIAEVERICEETRQKLLGVAANG